MDKNLYNPDLQSERMTKSFNINEMTTFLYGGEKKLKEYRMIREKLLENPKMFAEFEGKSAEEMYDQGIERSVLFFEISLKNNWNFYQIKIAHECLATGLPLSLQIMMFIPTLERLATSEQQKLWMPLAKSFKMLGAYAQTEIGHGTNIISLKTRADFDFANDQFIMNTPFPNGIKWWPGGLGLSANHSIVIANLYVNNKCHGLEAFLVPIRNMQTHVPLPGVDVGDIGQKMGLKQSDNGYLILNNVKIPRTNMLMKYSELKKNGQYIKKGSPKANYSAMTLLRSDFVRIVAAGLSAATTIATRYSCVRRQGYLNSNEDEVKILDYLTQQYKIIVNIANSYVLTIVALSVQEYYNCIYTETLSDNWSNLGELHSITCGLKAICSEISISGIEVVRRACGGHGYLESSGFGNYYSTILPIPTVEGENTVLYLQVGRYLLKSLSSNSFPNSLKYFNHNLVKPNSFSNVDDFLIAFQIRSVFQGRRISKKMQHCIINGDQPLLALNKNSQQLVRAAYCHSECLINDMFLKRFNNSPTGLKEILKKLFIITCLHKILNSSGEFIECNAICANQLDNLEENLKQLLNLIRNDAVNLMDAFDFSDMQLMSTIGSFDGRAYERMYEKAKQSPLNQKVQQAFFKYVKPFQTTAKL